MDVSSAACDTTKVLNFLPSLQPDGYPALPTFGTNHAEIANPTTGKKSDNLELLYHAYVLIRLQIEVYNLDVRADCANQALFTDFDLEDISGYNVQVPEASSRAPVIGAVEDTSSTKRVGSSGVMFPPTQKTQEMCMKIFKHFVIMRGV